MRCEDAIEQCGVPAWLLGACVMSYVQASGEAREKALRPPAGGGVDVAADLQRCVPPDDDEVEALREGVASRQPLSNGSTRFGGTACCKIRKGAGRRARRPRRRAMICGDSSDACGSA